MKKKTTGRRYLDDLRIRNVRDLKDALQQGSVAWSGGYPMYFVTADGERLSFKTVKKNLREVKEAIATNDVRSGLRVIAVDVYWEGPTEFDLEGEPIESAYGDPEEAGR